MKKRVFIFVITLTILCIGVMYAFFDANGIVVEGAIRSTSSVEEEITNKWVDLTGARELLQISPSSIKDTPATTDLVFDSSVSFSSVWMFISNSKVSAFPVTVDLYEWKGSYNTTKEGTAVAHVEGIYTGNRYLVVSFDEEIEPGAYMVHYSFDRSNLTHSGAGADWIQIHTYPTLNAKKTMLYFDGVFKNDYMVRGGVISTEHPDGIPMELFNVISEGTISSAGATDEITNKWVEVVGSPTLLNISPSANKDIPATTDLVFDSNVSFSSVWMFISNSKVTALPVTVDLYEWKDSYNATLEGTAVAHVVGTFTSYRYLIVTFDEVIEPGAYMVRYTFDRSYLTHSSAEGGVVDWMQIHTYPASDSYKTKLYFDGVFKKDYMVRGGVISTEHPNGIPMESFNVVSGGAISLIQGADIDPSARLGIMDDSKRILYSLRGGSYTQSSADVGILFNSKVSFDTVCVYLANINNENTVKIGAKVYEWKGNYNDTVSSTVIAQTSGTNTNIGWVSVNFFSSINPGEYLIVLTMDLTQSPGFVQLIAYPEVQPGKAVSFVNGLAIEHGYVFSGCVLSKDYPRGLSLDKFEEVTEVFNNLRTGPASVGESDPWFSSNYDKRNWLYNGNKVECDEYAMLFNSTNQNFNMIYLFFTNDASALYTVNIYRWDTNYAKTVNSNPLYSTGQQTYTLNNGVLLLQPSMEFVKGQYLVVYRFDFSEYEGSYFGVCAGDAVDETKIKSYNNGYLVDNSLTPRGGIKVITNNLSLINLLDETAGMFYAGSQIRTAFNGFEKQGLRFCFDYVPYIDGIVEYNGIEYKVKDMGAFMASKQKFGALSFEEIGNAMKFNDQGQIDSMYSFVKSINSLATYTSPLDGKTYKASYIYNIPESGINNEFVTRLYVKCQDTDGNIMYFYSDLVTNSVQSVYIAGAYNDITDSNVHAWFEGAWD